MDIFSKEKRSMMMSNIRSLDSSPEKLIRSELFRMGFRFRKNVAELPGKPDIVLPRFQTIIFVNGCFWHSHENCSNGRIPSSNQDFWIPKLKRNKERDCLNEQALKAAGWTVIVVWECEIRKNLNKVVNLLKKKIQKEH